MAEMKGPSRRHSSTRCERASPACTVLRTRPRPGIELRTDYWRHDLLHKVLSQTPEGQVALARVQTLEK